MALKATFAEEEDFFRDHLKRSSDQRDIDRVIDREVLRNYMMIPRRPATMNNMDMPRPVLKDTETHVIIETLLSKVLLSSLSEMGFLQALPVGLEDAGSAITTSALLERTFRIGQNYRNMYVAFKEAFLWGATTIWPSWVFEETDMEVQRVEIDPLTGQEFLLSNQERRVTRDDIELIPVDVDDFFPDPGHDTVANMPFAARRYVIPTHKALDFADEGRWDKEQVNKAIMKGSRENDTTKTSGSSSDPERTTQLQSKSWRDSIDRTTHMQDNPEFKPLIAFEGWGEVPYNPRDGIRRRRLTMLNGVMVESRPSPIRTIQRIPCADFVVNPILGRWRGVSPGAVARFSQDFADALLMCLAGAVVRKTDPPILYDEHAGGNIAQLKAWRGPMKVRNINGFKEIDYNPQIQEAANLYGLLKVNMEEGTGAQGGIQGQGLGSKRFSATEAAQTFQAQLGRPEMMAQLFEAAPLPQLGVLCLEMYQQMLVTTQEVKKRVGVDKYTKREPRLADIQGEFDIKFVGSRRMRSKEVQLQFIERSMQLFGSIPGAAPMYPWAPALLKWLELADLRDIESMVADPNGVEDYMTAHLMAASGGQAPISGNGSTLPSLDIPGLAPAQAAGTAIEPAGVTS